MYVLEQRGHIEWRVKNLIKKRTEFPKKEKKDKLFNKQNLEHTITKISQAEASEENIKQLIIWLERVSKFIPIKTEKELEDIIKIMILLSRERAKINYLYDYPGIELMEKVRECMIRYFVVLSEIRATRKEYISHWFLEQYWVFEWSHALFGLDPSENLENYDFPDLTAGDLLHMLTLELACADSVSKLEKPMIRMQPLDDTMKQFILIPTYIAANNYDIQVSKILKGELTFSEWVEDTLKAYELYIYD